MSELLILKYRYDTTYFINGVYKRRNISLLRNDNKKLEILFIKIFIEREWIILNQTKTKNQTMTNWAVPVHLPRLSAMITSQSEILIYTTTKAKTSIASAGRHFFQQPGPTKIQ